MAARTLMIVGLGNNGSSFVHTRHNMGMLLVDYVYQRLKSSLGSTVSSATSCSAPQAWISSKDAWLASLSLAEWHHFVEEVQISLNSATGPDSSMKNVSSRINGATASLVAEETAQMLDHAVMPAPPLVKIMLVKPKAFMNACGVNVERERKRHAVDLKDMLVVHDEMEKPLDRMSFKKLGSANGHNGLKSLIKHFQSDEFERLRVGIGRPESRNPFTVSKYVLDTFSENELLVIRTRLIDRFVKEVDKWIQGRTQTHQTQALSAVSPTEPSEAR